MQCKVEDQKQVGARFRVLCVNNVVSYTREIAVGDYLTFISRPATLDGDHMVAQSRSL